MKAARNKLSAEKLAALLENAFARDALDRPQRAPALFLDRERLVATATFRMMLDDDPPGDWFDDDVPAAVHHLWDRAGRPADKLTPDHLDVVFAWAKENASNVPALVDTVNRIRAATERVSDSLFTLKPGGVYYYTETKDGEPDFLLVCSPVRVLALTRNHAGQEWGRLLEIEDRDGVKKTWAMPAALLSGTGEEARKALMGLGMIPGPSPKARGLLNQYLLEPVADHARCVSRIGWHAQQYVLPDGTVFGPTSDDNIVLQTDTPVDGHFAVAGVIDAWQDAVGRLCVGNSRLVLAVSAALAATLLHPAGAEGGGFHLVGASSTGKTTALHVAGSVCGGGGVRGFIKSWRATANGLESIATAHCDALLCLDEIAQVPAKDAADTAYMLANGQGKARANKDGSGRKPAEWRVLFLSTGEITLADKIREDGRGQAKAGQAVRVVDIPADAGKGHGLFEELHGHADGGAFARALKGATERDFGTPLRAFLEALTANYGRAVDYVARKVSAFANEHTPAGADGQVARVASRFGLLAAAGELGTKLSVLPWPEGEATRAAVTCFRDWLEQRGGTGPHEIDKGIEQVKTFLLKHGLSRFQHMDLNNDLPVVHRDRAGFREGNEDGHHFYIDPKVWADEVCAGFNARTIAVELARTERLQLGSDGKTARNIRCPGIGQRKMVHILPSLLADGQTCEGEEEGGCYPCYPGEEEGGNKA